MESELLRLFAYVVISLVSAAFAFGGAYYAVKVRLGYVEQKTEDNKLDLRDHRAETKGNFDRVHDEFQNVHGRINRTNERIRGANGKGAST